MKKTDKKDFIFWAPRIMAIIFIAFLALFSLDVFGQGYGFWEIVLGLLVHNIPSFILAFILWLSWKREIVGAVAFFAAGALYLLQLTLNAIRHPPFEWYMLSWGLVIAGPAFVVGLLFLLGWCKRRKAKAAPKQGSRMKRRS